MQPDVPEETAERATTKRVMARYEIGADGSFSVSLQGSFGSAEVDEAVMKAARRWKWKPALRDGVPIASSVLVPFVLR